MDYVRHIRLDTRLSALSCLESRSVEELQVYYEDNISLNKLLNDLKGVNKIEKLSILQDLEVLSTDWCEEIVGTHYVQQLNVVGFKVESIHAVKSHYLNQLFHLRMSCQGMYSLDGENVGSIRVLELDNCVNLTMITGEFHNYSVTITQCKKLTNVNSLSKVKKLIIRECHSLTDVSALGKIPYLDLFFCYNLKDVTGLGQGNVTLILSYTSVEKVSHLKTVRTLDLRNCTNESRIDALEHLVGFVPKLILD
jgi:hypothetical protein